MHFRGSAGPRRWHTRARALSYERTAPTTHPRDPGRWPLTKDDLEDALEALHPESFGWALACCDRDRSLAEEVLQMSYVKVLEDRARFSGRSSVKTWFFGVIRRTAAEERRRSWIAAARRVRFAAAHLVAPAEAHAAGEADAAVDSSRSARVLHDALALLSRRQREVLHLVFYQGLTIEDASRAMEVSLGSARRHYQRGKEHLRRILPDGVRR